MIGAWTDARVARGMGVQLARLRDASDERIGWKIGMNAPAFQEKVGLDGSLVGQLFGSRVLASGGTYPLGGAVNPRIEPEVAVLVGSDGVSVGSVAPALEIVDLDGPLEEIEEALAGNIFHRAVVLGAWVEGPSGLTAAGEGGLFVDDSAAGTTGGVTVSELEAVVRYVAAYLAAFGELLRPGDRVITGTLAPPPAVSAGELWRFDAGPLGDVSVAFVA
jgi:2-keto-4-pentenoate hydratase